MEGGGEPAAAVEVERGVRLDRGRDRQRGRGIARPLPAVPVGEGAVGAVAPRDHERLDPALVLRPRPEESRALRRAEPLVAVAGVDVRAERLEIERELARCVGAVDDRECPRRPRRGADLRHRQHERRRRGDVADGDRPRPRPDRVHELVRLGVDEPRAHELPGPRDGAVLVPGRQHLVAGLEPERADDGVQSGGSVRDEDEIVGSRAEEGGQRGARPGRQLVESAGEELDRVALELALQLLVAREDGRRAGAVAAVVEERDPRVEQEIQAATVSRCSASSAA